MPQLASFSGKKQAQPAPAVITLRSGQFWVGCGLSRCAFVSPLLPVRHSLGDGGCVESLKSLQPNTLIHFSSKTAVFRKNN
jgi:hypothetical protein